MATLNSYFGLLKWTNGHNITAGIMADLKASEWAKVFDFHETKVSIKPYATKEKYYYRKNRQRRREELKRNSILIAE